MDPPLFVVYDGVHIRLSMRRRMIRADLESGQSFHTIRSSLARREDRQLGYLSNQQSTNNPMREGLSDGEPERKRAKIRTGRNPSQTSLWLPVS
jgi:hypothetical protein